MAGETQDLWWVSRYQSGRGGPFEVVKMTVPVPVAWGTYHYPDGPRGNAYRLDPKLCFKTEAEAVKHRRKLLECAAEDARYRAVAARCEASEAQGRAEEAQREYEWLIPYLEACDESAG